MKLCWWKLLKVLNAVIHRPHFIQHSPYNKCLAYIVSYMNLAGRVLGRREGPVISFLGIPFAEPPVGALRFRPTKPRAPWAPAILKALNYQADCHQSALYAVGDGSPKDEDCLYLNIWYPAKSKDLSTLPVLFWIYGGAFQQGSSSKPEYIGNKLAARGVMVVSCNYRLGALGFLVSTKDGLFGNYGLHDQKVAIQWVQDHIHNFGGDPDRVTLFGESAGNALMILVIEIFIICALEFSTKSCHNAIL